MDELARSFCATRIVLPSYELGDRQLSFLIMIV